MTAHTADSWLSSRAEDDEEGDNKVCPNLWRPGVIQRGSHITICCLTSSSLFFYSSHLVAPSPPPAAFRVCGTYCPTASKPTSSTMADDKIDWGRVAQGTAIMMAVGLLDSVADEPSTTPRLRTGWKCFLAAAAVGLNVSAFTKEGGPWNEGGEDGLHLKIYLGVLTAAAAGFTYNALAAK